MYAEYWNPMNWNSRIESMNGKTVVEKMSLKKLLLDVRDQRRPSPESAICAAVTPPV